MIDPVTGIERYITLQGLQVSRGRIFLMEIYMQICKCNSHGWCETGELLEYWHLIQQPKYKEEWGVLFGNEIGRLRQGIE